MHSFQAGCEWFSRNQDGDIPPLPIGRGQHLGGIGRIVRNHCLFEQPLLRMHVFVRGAGIVLLDSFVFSPSSIIGVDK
ncbi:hypothetical protein SAMN05421736_101718 [Evansella caseinilytica]|uniref:Uncharacterized protein n=1 Tax=Evansella caseinilytica TaxID=1503961 RepID=A0A1H3I505_9BACI|nr:hypothetical protein [Evansella caseinilytica]SDY22712.1 hypothetical protein SAMN05421736_101718 [Evansella caseinilytica]